ncbi:MAG TPA: carboxylesterase family protein [Microthrixaceae bacterium]|nr:carboxylesterase family protein [Microthrixaceae bacterium]
MVRTRAGAVRGECVDGVHRFLGVPFAEPPVGARRFALPERRAPWSDVLDATVHGPTATQPLLPSGLFPQTIVEGDDCLHLDVYTTALDGLRPVVVWIHGGGMVMGSNVDLDGSGLARRGVVVVAPNYRLGVDGFLTIEGAPNNRGVADWLLALEWVRDNVERFGGDPANVTIAGQSAGSAACLNLLTLPRSAGLFRRVYAMSGTPWNQVDLVRARTHAAELAGRLGIEATVDGVASVPVDQLMAVQHELAPVGGIDATGSTLDQVHHLATLEGWLGPVVDGELVPCHPLTAIAQGAGGDLDVAVGSTAEEMDALMLLMGADVTASDADAAYARLGLDPDAVDAWRRDAPDRTSGQELGAALTALSFRVPALDVAELRARADGPASTFVYELTWRPPTPIGAVHGIDVFLALDALDGDVAPMLMGGEAPRSLVDDVAGAVVRFAIDGDPGWPAYQLATRTERAFDVPSRLRTDPGASARRLFGPIRGRGD